MFIYLVLQYPCEKHGSKTIFTSNNVMNIQYGIGGVFGSIERAYSMGVNEYFGPKRIKQLWLSEFVFKQFKVRDMFAQSYSVLSVLHNILNRFFALTFHHFTSLDFLRRDNKDNYL